MKRQLKNFLSFATSTDVQIGFRLCLVCMFMLTAQWLPVLLGLFTPIATPWSQNLGLTAEEQKAQDEIIGKLKKYAKKEVEDAVKAINEDGEKKIDAIVEKKVAPFKDLPVDKLKQMLEDVEEMNKTVADLKAKATTAKANNEKENLIQKALAENWENMQKKFSSGGKSFSFKLEEKVTSTSFGDRVIFGFREAGIDTAALPEAFILDLISVMSGGPGSNPLSWIERNQVTGVVGGQTYVAEHETVAEGETKPKLNWSWVERKMPSTTIAVTVPITKQAVYNYPLLENEVRTELLRIFALVLQKKILKGAGTGTGDDVKGLFEYATPFAAGAFAGAVENANEFDVLVAAITQILNANFVPTTALVTHNTKGLMNLRKGTDGHYVLPPFITAGGLQVYGVNVKSTNVLVDDEFLVADFKRALWNWVENPQIEVGYINDDFEKNIWRLRNEAQGMLRIKNHETPAFVKGDFSVAISEIGA